MGIRNLILIISVFCYTSLFSIDQIENGLTNKIFVSICEGEISLKIKFINNEKAEFVYESFWSEDDDNGGSLKRNAMVNYSFNGLNEINVKRMGKEYIFLYSKYLWFFEYELPFEGIILVNPEKDDEFFEDYCLKVMYESSQEKSGKLGILKKEERLIFLTNLIKEEKNVNLRQIFLSILDKSPVVLENKIKENTKLVNNRSIFNDTPLLFAVKHFNYPEVLDILLKYGANVNDSVKIGRFEGKNVIDIFIEKIIKKEEIPDYLKCFEKLMFQTGDFYSYPENNIYGLEKPVKFKREDYFKKIIEKNIIVKSKVKIDLLFIGIKIRDKSVVDALLKDNDIIKDINKKNSQGITPLQFVRQNGLKEIEELLKKHGAKE